MKKRILVLLMALVLVGSLAGCHEGMISSETNITSREGAGTKTITVDIMNDDGKVPVGQYKGTDVGNNSKFLLIHGDALVTYIKGKMKLSDATVKSEQLSDRERVSITYSFTSIADYNAKTKTLADGTALTDATLTVSGDDVTFSENPTMTEKSIEKLLLTLFNDTAAFSKDGSGDMGGTDVTYEQTFRLYNVVYKVADQKVETDVYDITSNGEEVEVVSVTGKIAGSGGDTTGTPATTPANADTGVETTVSLAVLFLLLAAGVLTVLNVRKVRN